MSATLKFKRLGPGYYEARGRTKVADGSIMKMVQVKITIDRNPEAKYGQWGLTIESLDGATEYMGRTDATYDTYREAKQSAQSALNSGFTWYKGLGYCLTPWKTSATDNPQRTGKLLKQRNIRKLPPKSVIEKAVKNMQFYLGYIRDPRGRIQDQKRLKARVDRSIATIVKSTGNTEDNVWMQLEGEARRRGLMMPLPGKDF